jgi:TRAP-type uncharacterized transport system substrate-binding protein
LRRLCCVAALLWPLPAAAQGSFEALVKAEKTEKTDAAPPAVQRSAPRIPQAAKKPGDGPARQEEQTRARHNQWTVGIAGGLPEDSFSLYAADLAKALDDGESLRVLPIMSYGAAGNVRDLLYLNGVDVAITYADALHHFKSVEKIPNLDRRLNYIVPMFQAEVHLLVRPEIKSIADLAGKKVGFDTPGSGANTTGGIVFDRLGVSVDKVFLNNALALAAMARGEIAGIVHIAGKPSHLFARLHPELGFHFLPVAYSEKFQDHYVPAKLTSAEYPNLVPDGHAVRTISVQAVLAVNDAPKDSDRYRRSVRFVEHLFAHFDKLRAFPFQPGWKEMNLAGTIPGWARFAPAQDILDKSMARSSIDPALARKQAIRAAPTDRVEQERLFEQFMHWSKQQKRE